MRNLWLDRVLASIHWWVACTMIIMGFAILPVWPVALLPLTLGFMELIDAGLSLDHAYGFSA